MSKVQCFLLAACYNCFSLFLWSHVKLYSQRNEHSRNKSKLQEKKTKLINYVARGRFSCNGHVVFPYNVFTRLQQSEAFKRASAFFVLISPTHSYSTFLFYPIKWLKITIIYQQRKYPRQVWCFVNFYTLLLDAFYWELWNKISQFKVKCQVSHCYVNGKKYKALGFNCWPTFTRPTTTHICNIT